MGEGINHINNDEMQLPQKITIKVYMVLITITKKNDNSKITLGMREDSQGPSS